MLRDKVKDKDFFDKWITYNQGKIQKNNDVWTQTS